ncbi:DUF1015 domain-containing protein [Desulfatiglans anilini]|uniref:DUF1015 domain-containing protein n=1 Tax=Desulfatiglans anilini TaxID=90728 RepID=UPI0004800E9F|nr:DUF1015 domain-containing protein [Desulfatiglans anilini]
MTIIAPFRGLTYSPDLFDQLPNLTAPPYDVISPEEQEGYYQKNPFNVIRLILGKKKTGDSDWDNPYTRAADLFRRWQSQGILRQADQPCMYVTALDYDPGNGEPRRTRWGVIAAVKIEEPDSGVILPHEKTFSAHKDDRLRLMRACGAQFSQIFGLYEDAENRVKGALNRVVERAPVLDFPFHDGTNHRMWEVDDPAVFRSISDTLADKRIFIADGHHRYETARNYRNLMRTRYGQQSPGRSYEYVMMYLSNMSDEGLTILPSHRLIKRVPGFDLDRFLERSSAWFEIEPVSLPKTPSDAEYMELRDSLAEAGRVTSAFALVLHGDERVFLFTLKPGARKEMGDDLHDSLKKLDVLVLSRLAFQKGMGFSREDLDNPELFFYQSGFRKAANDVRQGRYQLGFLLNPTRMEHVKEVAGNALVMPRKSTFFFPKVLTGLVFNKLDPDDVITVP